MRSFAIATLLSAVCAVNAATNVTIKVGLNGEDSYTPSGNITAFVGGFVNFISDGGTHTVTQSANRSSCAPMKGGFDSGVLKEGQVYSHPVTKAGPTYIICRIENHCQRGMKIAINAITDPQAAPGKNSSTPTKSPSPPPTAGTTGGTPSPTGTPAGASNSTGASANSTGLDGASNSTGADGATNSTDGSDNSTDPNSARQVGGGFVLGTTMALLVGLAL